MKKKRSIKTTLGGVGAILAGLGILGKCINDMLESGSLNLEEAGVGLGLISSGVVGLAARDNGVSSEDAGAK